MLTEQQMVGTDEAYDIRGSYAYSPRLSDNSKIMLIFREKK